MSLKIYISNDIENLAGKLADSIHSNPLDLFQKEYIVIQTEGMSRWLSVKIAEKNGIFSNFAFFSPNDILFELFKLANIHTSDIFNINNLRWLIYNILGTKSFKIKFTGTYQYFKEDKIKQLQLATKLADLYDQYSIYRPDYIRLWNEDKAAMVKPSMIYHEKWQRWVWNRIKEKAKEYDFDKVEIRNQLLEKLEADEDFIKKIKNKFSRISLFGFSIFTPFHLEVFLGKLKDYIDIDFYLFNPAPEDYWLQDIPEKTKVKIENYYGKSSEELRVGNNLLMNLGATAKDLYLMLFQNEDFINSLDNETLINPPDKSSLLKVIQNEIYNNITGNQREKIPENIVFDRSINITSNYSMVREVEVLYNYLLKQIQDHNYKPGDIIIQTTNIDAYTPYIKAVFDNAPVRLPYVVADRSYSGTDNLIGIIKQILVLQKDEFTSENVLQILELDVVRRKFDIGNLSIIRKLVEKANIRHGIEGNIRDDTLFVSWRYGLERILLGYAMNHDSLYRIPDKDYKTIPLDIAEGEFAIEGLKLIQFVNTLIWFINERNVKRTLDEWRVFITEFIDKIMEIPDDKSDELNYILNKLSYAEIVEELLDEKFSYDIFSHAFIDSLYLNNRSGKFISGQITFCSMIPMRSIPYKIVGILGLNQGVFPRKNKDTDINLILSEKRYGDRNIKDTDKYLFLESLISAKDKLYLSYIGQSIKDNSDIPPSTVIDELLDYIEAGSGIEEIKKKMVIKHPLHNFNNKYFDPQFKDYYTFLDYGKSEQTPLNTGKKSMESHEITEIDLNKLTGFYKDPIKWYFNNILRIYYNENSVLLPETEVFELDNITRYQIKTKLLKDPEIFLDGDYITGQIIRGNLPLKNLSLLKIYQINDKLKELIAKYRKEIKGFEEKKYNIAIKLNNNITITGEIKSIWNDTLIIPVFSKNNAKYIAMFQLYRWICTVADIPVNRFVLLGIDEKSDLDLSLIDKNVAEENLTKAIDYFNNSYTKIPAFYPDASYLYIKLKSKNSRSKKDPLDTFVKSFNLSEKKENNYNNEIYINPYLIKLSEERYFEQFFDREEEIKEMGELFFGEILK